MSKHVVRLASSFSPQRASTNPCKRASNLSWSSGTWRYCSPASRYRCFSSKAYLQSNNNGTEESSNVSDTSVRVVQPRKGGQSISDPRSQFLLGNKPSKGKSLLDCCTEIVPKLARKRAVRLYRQTPSLVLSYDETASNGTKQIEQDLGLWINAVLASPQRSDLARHISIEIAHDVFVHSISQSVKSLCIEVEIQKAAKGNALSSQLLINLANVFKAIATIGKIDAVVLSGGIKPHKTPVFCGGADVNELQNIMSEAGALNFIGRVSNLCTEIRKLPAPVVAAIDGPCIGAGLEVAASCDIRVATTSSTFSMPEVLLGIPSVVEARLLCDIVGWGRARHLMLTACNWNANEAYQYGLITQRFKTRRDMFSWVHEFGAQCNTKIGVHKAQKELMRQWELSTIDDGIEAGKSSFAERFTEDLGPKVRNEMQVIVAERKKAKGSKDARKVDGAGEISHKQVNASSVTEIRSNHLSVQDEQPQ